MARTPVTFSLKDFFNSFKVRTNNKFGLSNREHKYLLDTTGEVLKDFVIEHGEIKMFGRLGMLMIRKVKPKGDKKAPIDFNESRKNACNAYHFNDHSDGFIVRIIWERKNAILADKHMWHFKPVRAFKRRLAQVMKSSEFEYPILTK
jgi:hypothetical protein